MRFEYKQVVIHRYTLDPHKAEVEAELNKLGEQGWMLVGVDAISESDPIYTFVREKVES